MTFDWKLLLTSAAAGLVALIVDILLYNALVDALPRPLLIAIMIAVLAALVCVAIAVTVTVTNSTSDEFLFLGSRGMLWAGVAVCLVVLFLGSMLLEWIYDHEELQTMDSTAYIFILDESGSMASNDPSYERYDSVDQLMSAMSQDTPYAVYMFSNDCVKIRDMAPAGAGKLTRPDDANFTMMGMTYIRNALEVVYADLDSGAIDGGAHPHVVLLTDGYASDMDRFTDTQILKDYASSRIKISTVGLGNVDEALLEKIATSTNGQYVRVDEASQLASGFTNVTNVITDRDLTSYRPPVEQDGLYAFLRIAFLTLIGVLIAFMKLIALGDSDNTLLVLLEGAGAALVGALVMEFGLSAGLPDYLCRGIYWLLVAITPRMIARKVIHIQNDQQVRTAFEVMNSGPPPGSSGGVKP